MCIVCLCLCACNTVCGGQRMTSQSLFSLSISTRVLRSKLRFPGLQNKHIYLLNHLMALETFGIITVRVRTSITNSHTPINQIQ